MLLSRYIVVAFLLASAGSAQVPDYYKKVNRVTWVVENIDKVRPAWEAIGLTDIREYPNIQLAGQFRGNQVTIYAWQITGRLGNLTVDMIQPAEGQANAYTNFLEKHGDGILSVGHDVGSRQALDQEILRMKAKGVGVLQRVTVQLDRARVSYTYFDTEPEGKFALGLVQGAPEIQGSASRPTVSHFGWIVWGAANVSAYWQRLGFPAFQTQRATVGEHGRYKGNPLALTFDVGFQTHTQFGYEWISPPPSPPNIYADFLNKHRIEGIQHIAIVVDDLTKSIAAFEKLGYHVHQSGTWGDVGKPKSGQYAFMDTDSAGGISVKLVRSW